jgi:hypothetical protein
VQHQAWLHNEVTQLLLAKLREQQVKTHKQVLQIKRQPDNFALIAQLLEQENQIENLIKYAIRGPQHWVSGSIGE